MKNFWAFDSSEAVLEQNQHSFYNYAFAATTYRAFIELYHRRTKWKTFEPLTVHKLA
jgi:hypothetical protein